MSNQSSPNILHQQDNNKHRTHSLSGALSISLGLSSSYGNTKNHDNNQYLGRSFVGSFNKIRQQQQLQPNESSIINNNTFLHQQTETIANDDDLFANVDDLDEQVFDDSLVDDSFARPNNININETSSLINPQNSITPYYYDYDLESQSKPPSGPNNRSSGKHSLDANISIQDFKPMKLISYIPAVILGLLLNILDGLSYGMIIFPIGEKVFSNLGSAGLSMFYISCIISQLVYSLGGSAFGAGIGSEMIEVTPFFHGMALNIMHELGEDHPMEIISTTITTYAISSIITGLIFLSLGKFKLGQIVGFFPRHILIGCIGGVGFFLIITGIEISSRLGSFEYSLEYLKLIFQWGNFIKIFIPILLTVVLVLLQHFNHNSLILPSFFISVFVITHILIILIPSWDLKSSRENGYMFSSGGSSSNSDPTKHEAWWEFYKLYNFKLVDWFIILKQIPSMLALTFFGILHVPINVPALAVSTKQDNIDVDRELIAHGLSNLISGCIGSIQNYLVYTNSLLFIRAGADSRVAGLLLAGATFLILIAGPVVIGFIPVCVVGSLIFLLGYELLKESLWDTISRVSRVEYLTILIIVLTMGVYDFVIGIIVGIIIASFHFLYENTKIPIIYNQFTGEVARSTVVRHPLQKQFLRQIGKQIYVLKLQSFLFFGTIGKIEKTVRELFEIENLHQNPIRYLILDFKNVLNIDFSAAEGLNRIKNFIIEQNAYLIISIGDKDKILTSLKNVGLFNHEEEYMITKLQVFKDLNASLEWCENEFLTKFKQYQKYKKFETTNAETIQNSKNNSYLQPPKKLNVLPINTPRNTNFIKEVSKFNLNESNIIETNQKLHGDDDETSNPILLSSSSNLKEPIPLLTFALQGVSGKEESFWKPLEGLFKKEVINVDKELQIDPKESFIILVETGIITVTYHINQNANIYETLLPRTIIGKIKDEVERKDRYKSVLKAKNQSIVWFLDNDTLNDLKCNKLELYNELLMVIAKANDERFENITGYTLIST
ncbi:putative membrane protein [Wickerhamomyces ciferrii]|uniref:Membrane protein n=1 Tax=Wickerhamomyces ciferrii (strain ATCC 14091 / BCRC 22168 / CBS 111 / JCM 3599 / NBRC 0793 / NRRL Y-1031 F-60-10) TaxID=1206466 RepID=K0KKC4_WICCF|nr:uncharacterized protein BN7_1114 [Wickerhamomyces ciferrii]CCH41573.1 putative membrane protein [Wickerhamomyces ciferrii]